MKKNVKNLPEFMALIKRYETITLEEIEDVFKDVRREFSSIGYSFLALGVDGEVKRRLTGFGNCQRCSLCKAAGTKPHPELTTNVQNCAPCVYGKSFGCLDHKTYDAISIAETPEELLDAYRERAEYMKTLLK